MVLFWFPGSRREFVLYGGPFFHFRGRRTSLCFPTGVAGNDLVAVSLKPHSLPCFLALQTIRPKHKISYFVGLNMRKKLKRIHRPYLACIFIRVKCECCQRRLCCILLHSFRVWTHSRSSCMAQPLSHAIPHMRTITQAPRLPHGVGGAFLPHRGTQKFMMGLKGQQPQVLLFAPTLPSLDVK